MKKNNHLIICLMALLVSLHLYADENNRAKIILDFILELSVFEWDCMY